MKQLSLLIFFICGAPLIGQELVQNPERHALCEKWESVSLPTEASAILEPKSFPRCDSYRLYSGIGTKRDFQAARKCAWSERLATKASLQQNYTDSISWAIGGSIILSELYANGEGVPRNIPLALRLACEDQNDDEAVSLIEDLESRLNQAPSAQKRFRYCDHALNTMMMNFCASYDAQIQDQRRSDTLHRLSAGWTPPQRDALEVLTQKAMAYSLAHARGEINTGGTIRTLMAIDAEQNLRNSFAAALEAFEKGDLPHTSAKEAADADSELNRVYRKVIAAAKAQCPDSGAPEPKGIQNAERVWIPYRDAWIAFTKLRYPSTSYESWLTLLTRDRTTVLKDILCEIGPTDGQPNLAPEKCETPDDGDVAPSRPLP